jgi:hypothetical protein
VAPVESAEEDEEDGAGEDEEEEEEEEEEVQVATPKTRGATAKRSKPPAQALTPTSKFQPRKKARN